MRITKISISEFQPEVNEESDNDSIPSYRKPVNAGLRGARRWDVENPVEEDVETDDEDLEIYVKKKPRQILDAEEEEEMEEGKCCSWCCCWCCGLCGKRRVARRSSSVAPEKVIVTSEDETA